MASWGSGGIYRSPPQRRWRRELDAAVCDRADGPRHRPHGAGADPRRGAGALFIQPPRISERDVGHFAGPRRPGLHGSLYGWRPNLDGASCVIRCRVIPGLDGCNPHGKLAQLLDGTLLMSVYLSYREGQAQASYQRSGLFGTYVLRSRDGGRTWGDASLLADGYVEPSLYVLPSGRLIGLVAQFMPGANLGRPSQMTAATPGARRGRSPATTILGRRPAVAKDGRLLLAYGHRSFPGGVRAMISRDEGRSWDQECKVILSVESVYQFCGGGSSVQLADGKIVTAYFQHQGSGPFLHPCTYWVSAGFFSGPYAASGQR